MLFSKRTFLNLKIMLTSCVSILETRFFGLFWNFFDVLRIMVITMDGRGHPLWLTEKKERTDQLFCKEGSINFWCNMMQWWATKRMFHVFQCECSKISWKNCNLKKKVFSKSPSRMDPALFSSFFLRVHGQKFWCFSVTR
jgi:hypothetical protein